MRRPPHQEDAWARLRIDVGAYGATRLTLVHRGRYVQTAVPQQALNEQTLLLKLDQAEHALGVPC